MPHVPVRLAYNEGREPKLTSRVEILAQTDRAAALDGGGSERIVWLRLRLPAASPEAKWPVHLGLAVDRSASMSGKKIILARQAVATAISRLGPTDAFAVVAYDDDAEVIVPLTRATDDARQAALAKVHAIVPDNDTNLFAGWLRSCEQVATGLTEKAVGRVILITDGLATRGVVDPDALAKQANEQRHAHVLTSTIGVGQDFDELTLSRIADGGGGHYHYVKKSEQLPAVVESVVGETLSVVACDARLCVQAPPGTVIESLNDYPLEPAHDGSVSTSVLALGDLVSHQQLDLILRVKLPSGRPQTRCTLRMTLTDRRRELTATPAHVEWTFVGQNENDAQPRNEEVTRQAARLFAAQARVQAWKLNREGKFALAEKVLLRVARTNRRVAETDPVQLALVQQLEVEARQVRSRLDAEESKDLFTRGYTAMRGLDEFSHICRVAFPEDVSAIVDAVAMGDTPPPLPSPSATEPSPRDDSRSPPMLVPTLPPTAAPEMRGRMRRVPRGSESNLGLWIFFGTLIALCLIWIASALLS